MNELCEAPHGLREIRRSKKDLLKPYEIRIQFLDHGCLVNVGCKTIAFVSIKDAMDALITYIENPAEEIEKWNKLFNEE